MRAELNVLVGQFAISHLAPAVPDDWHRESLSGWHLSAHPTTHVAALNGDAGARIGWLLGEPWNGSEMVGDSFAVPTNSADELEAALYDLGGPWLAFLPGLQRVYADAFGHLSALYSAGPSGSETVATAPVLIPGAEPDVELRSLFNIPAEDNLYPFGLTGYRNVRRLLPNHHLDLLNWKAARHWPTSDPEPVTVDKAAAEVGRLMEAGIDALATQSPLQISLTAGYDSRMVLASARRHVGGLLCVTNNSHPVSAKVDIALARRIAKRHGLRHIVRDRKEAVEAERRAWLLQTGEAGAGGAYEHLRLTDAYGTERARLSGQGGEVLQAYYYKGKTNGRAADYEADDVLALLNLPANAALNVAAETWIEGAGNVSGRDLLDLLYVEQRMGCWAGPLRWGGRSSHRVFWPVAHRQVQEIARRVPIEERKRKAIHLRVIECEWPELLDLPFNEPVGWVALKQQVRQVVGRARFRLGGLRRRVLPSS